MNLSSFLSRSAAPLAVAFAMASCGMREDASRPYESASARYLPAPDRTVLQTPCYKMVDARGRRVELTGAIHIAEKSYYQDLNRHLAKFDAVLFEGVGRPPSRRHASPATDSVSVRKQPEISRIYSVVAHDYLHLSLQSEEIDYVRPNFVHADLTAEEFEALLKQHDLTMDSVAKRNRFSPGLQTSRWLLTMMKYLIPHGSADEMKRSLAPGLAKAETNDGLAGSSYEVIVIERDKHLLKVMDRELAAGKRNLSLFYGSGHFPDLRKQLRARGWRDVGVEWRDAWIMGPQR